EATARGRAARSVMRVSMREDLGGRNGATGRSPATRRLHRPPPAEGPAWSQDLCRTFTRPGGGQLAATAVANWPRGRRADRRGGAPERLAAAEAGGAGDADQALAVHRGLEDLTLAPAGAAGRPDHARSLQKARTHCLHVVSIGTSRPGLNPTPCIRSVGWRTYV